MEESGHGALLLTLLRGQDDERSGKGGSDPLRDALLLLSGRKSGRGVRVGLGNALTIFADVTGNLSSEDPRPYACRHCKPGGHELQAGVGSRLRLARKACPVTEDESESANPVHDHGDQLDGRPPRPPRGGEPQSLRRVLRSFT